MKKKQVYIKTFGCQMNKYDSELVTGLLDSGGYSFSETAETADVILINTCAVRENAEQRVYGNIDQYAALKKKNPGLILGILGCMAQRLGNDLRKKKPAVDLVIGPDEYRNLPSVLSSEKEYTGSYTDLAKNENYDDIRPKRIGSVSAWVAIMRGCRNYCSYCIVPYVRGPERSRPYKSIVQEIVTLVQNGFKEVTLLGQNVNSYNDNGISFPSLLEIVSKIDGLKRIRFATSHPKDLSNSLIRVIGEYDNICKYIHLPFQSGSNKVLKLMNRNYTREHYISLINKTREFIPGIAFSTDIITGFPGETKADYRDTLELVKEVQFDSAFIFRYSVRKGTKAASFADDVPYKEKIRRLEEISDLQNSISMEKNSRFIGAVAEVLIESPSRRSEAEMKGRTDDNRKVIVSGTRAVPGDFIRVKITRCSSQTLFGEQADDH